MKINFLFIFLLTYGFSNAQNVEKKFWVEFADKENSPFSIEKPEDFLSQRAIERRTRYNIEIDSTDLPVNPSYLEALEELGATIHNPSKWLNSTSVVATDSIMDLARALPFVKSIEYVGRHYIQKKGNRSLRRDTIIRQEFLPDYYGYASQQIQMINGDSLHQLGWKGKGKLIAIQDGGFINVDLSIFFDSLRNNDQILITRDFVDGDSSVFESSGHGTQVLSTIAANIPGIMVGTAPSANFACLKTEDVQGEYLIEECNWVTGLEFADSLGADVINSSLGYTTFNDTMMNHTYEILDGKTAIASRGSAIGFSKGMIIVNSAGNEGSNGWKYVGVPADGAYVFSIGATNLKGKKSRFSSFGPTADDRIKPDVSALGSRVVVASPYGANTGFANGTSLSSPIMAGMVACLWEAFPQKTNTEILQAVRMSGNQADEPDNKLGYGIPDFMKAYRILNSTPEEEKIEEEVEITPKN